MDSKRVYTVPVSRCKPSFAPLGASFDHRSYRTVAWVRLRTAADWAAEADPVGAAGTAALVAAAERAVASVAPVARVAPAGAGVAPVALRQTG